MYIYFYILPLLIVTVSILLISEFKKVKMGYYITKPIATTLIIICAVLSNLYPGSNPTYTLFITAGLVFSLFGDVLLMFKEYKNFFLFGLIFFLLAHVVYGTTYIYFGGIPKETWWIAIIWAAVGVAVYLYLHSGLGKMRIPVGLYTAVICFMMTFAMSTLFSDSMNKDLAWLVTFGGFLFLLSDVGLAVDRFKVPLKYERVALVAYFFGQFLIAVSTYYFNPGF
jgi:uncharacterized membrane protein YhhN